MVDLHKNESTIRNYESHMTDEYEWFVNFEVYVFDEQFEGLGKILTNVSRDRSAEIQWNFSTVKPVSKESVIDNGLLYQTLIDMTAEDYGYDVNDERYADFWQYLSDMCLDFDMYEQTYSREWMVEKLNCLIYSLRFRLCEDHSGRYLGELFLVITGPIGGWAEIEAEQIQHDTGWQLVHVESYGRSAMILLGEVDLGNDLDFDAAVNMTTSWLSIIDERILSQNSST